MSQTPLLDCEQPLPARRVPWVRAILGGVVLAAFLIALDRAQGPRGPLSLLQSSPILLLPAFYVAVFIHELGHLVAARIAEFELRAFLVGVFLFNKENTRWRFRFVPRYVLFGGYTVAMPRTPESLLNRYRNFILGGPLASYCLLLLTSLLPAGPFVRILFWINLLLAILATVPRTTATLPNDTKLLLLLKRKGPVAERIVALIHLAALDAQGKRPPELPRELIQAIAVETQDISRLPQAFTFLLSDAADREDFAQMAQILERAFTISDRLLPELKRGFMASAASYHGFHKQNASLAQEWLSRARSVKGPKPQDDWDAQALAAIRYAEGENHQAAQFLIRYVALLERQPLSGMVLAERDRTLKLMNALTESV